MQIRTVHLLLIKVLLLRAVCRRIQLQHVLNCLRIAEVGCWCSLPAIEPVELGFTRGRIVELTHRLLVENRIEHFQHHVLEGQQVEVGHVVNSFRIVAIRPVVNNEFVHILLR